MTSAARMIKSLEISSIDQTLDIAILGERPSWPAQFLQITEMAFALPLTNGVTLRLSSEDYEIGYAAA